MLGYKSIITRRYALGSNDRELASMSGINGFLKAFEAYKELSYPLSERITNEGIHELDLNEDYATWALLCVIH